MFVWRCCRRHLVQLLAHQLTLQLRPLENGRTTSNLFVLLLHLRCTSLCNPRSKPALHWQLNHIPIRHNAQQIVVHLIRVLRSTHVQHKYRRLRFLLLAAIASRVGGEIANIVCKQIIWVSVTIKNIYVYLLASSLHIFLLCKNIVVLEIPFSLPVSGDVINADTIALLDNDKYFRFTAGAIHRHKATVAGSYHFVIYRYITNA